MADILSDRDKGMFIPTIGDEITLASDWTFGLYYEYRNEAMICFTFPGVQFKWNDMQLPSGEKPVYGAKIADVLFPKGTVLKVDRIYIRKGNAAMKEFDSVTFILQSIPKKDIAVEIPKDTYVLDGTLNKDGEPNWKLAKTTKLSKKPRFWVKLRDVNKIRFLRGREEIPDDEPKAVRRLIRFDERSMT